MEDTRAAGTEGRAEDALSRAQAALESSRVALARDLLEDHVAVVRDPDAFKLLGEVRHRLGDEAGAGAAWFATSAKGPVIDAAVAAWRSAHDDDWAAMWASLPESAKHGELTPKLAALKAKAVAAEPHPQPGPASVPAPVPATDEPAAEARPEALRPAAPARRQPRVTPSTEEAPRPEPTKPAASETVSAARPARRSVTPFPADPPARASDSDPEREGAPAAKEGFDAAKAIFWVLSALFVACAIVGLITILRWLVPGG